MDDQEIVDLFNDAWNSIKPQGKTSVYVQQLWIYFRKKKIEERHVNSIMNQFKLTGDEKITLDEFERVLGALMMKIQQKTKRVVQTTAVSLPDGVEFISGDMELSWQIKIAQLCIDGLRSIPVMKDLPKWIKTRADDQYSQMWHVVIVNGQFWCFYGHEPGYSFAFRYEKYIFVIWKTPSS